MRDARAGTLGLAVFGAAICTPVAWTAPASAGELSTEALWSGGTGTDARAGCLRAGGRILEMPVAHVNPFGLDGDAAAAPEPALQPDEAKSALCVFGATGPGATVSATVWPAAALDDLATSSIGTGPFGGACAEECDASLTLLSDADREQLIALPERVRQTLLAAGTSAPGDDGGTRVAREAAATLAGERPETAEASVAPLDLSQGDMDCTWRRFDGRRARVEPTGRCRIGRDAAGAPTLEEIVGDGLAVRLEPLTDRYSLYLGRVSGSDGAERAYDPAAGEADASNRTGLAARVGHQVHLVEASGASGFAVLTLSGN